jgi:xanthine phosphoribosyltransferase
MSTYWEEMKGKMDKVYLTWQDFNEFIKWAEVTVKVLPRQSKGGYRGIYGVPRGGLPIAVALSHRLNIPLLMAPDDNIIIVDDIWDTGKTLLPLYERYIIKGDSLLFVWLFNAKRSEDIDDNYSNDAGFQYGRISDGKWYYFPWEY